MKTALACAALVVLAGCASAPPQKPIPAPVSPIPAPVAPIAAPVAPIAWSDDSRATQFMVLNRVTFGANPSGMREIRALGTGEWLARQLRPAAEPRLPLQAQEYVAAMTISQRTVVELVADMERRRLAFQELTGEERKLAQQAYQEELTRLAREAAARFLLRALYSPDQLREEMTWFWMNHFSVFQYKDGLRMLMGDYEERAVWPHALGRFRDLLGAVARHPAMLIYLDNVQNAAGGINENYARELMELHTLGVRGGYAQADVQELARVLTGFGVKQGDFRFDPERHDSEAKTLLGRPLRSRGEAELDEALDLLAVHPSTSRFISRKLAMHFVADDPPEALVERMATAFRGSDGDIAATLRAMFESPEFRGSLGGKFKDPLHYMVSATRLSSDQVVLQRPGLERMINGLAGMGQPLYGRPTPDGYPLTRVEWASPGQLAVRFEVARGVGYRSNARITSHDFLPLSDSTRVALSKTTQPQEWNMLLLASPEFMVR